MEDINVEESTDILIESNTDIKKEDDKKKVKNVKKKEQVKSNIFPDESKFSEK